MGITQPLFAEPEHKGFDPDLSPTNPQNVSAADKLGLRWDNKKQAFCDEEGSLVRDRFGQLL